MAYIGVRPAGISNAAEVEVTGDLTVDTNTLHVDATNNRVGIGTSSPSGNLNISDGTSAQLNINSGATGFTRQILFSTGTNTQEAKISSDNATGELRFEAGRSGTSSYIQTFYTNNNERMRIDSSGNLLVGAATNYAGGNGQGIQAKASQNAAICCSRSDEDGATVRFFRDNTLVGNISVTSSSTSYNTSSDYRLKENAVDMTGAIARVKALAPKRFNFIADDSVTVDGFMAHEAQTVVPEAVTGTHNEVDDDGNAVMQGIDQSKLVPLLTGALQEAITKIEALETQRADLEARLTALENA